jgi:hypothetical protein
MAAVRLSQLQKRILQWLAADHERARGAIASHHQELVRALHSDKGHLSHRLRPLERPGFLVIGRSTGEAAESLHLAVAG